jgi:putative ABC transport system permease protein
MVSLFFLDSLDYILKQQFFRFQKQDYTVKFSKPVPSDEARQLYNINGIEKIEFITEAPLQLQNGTKKEEAIVIGLVDQNSLIELVDMKGSEIKVPNTGIILSNTTAKTLSLKPGDKISIKPLSGNQEPVTISVVAIAKQYTGSTCYMNSSELQKILGSKIFTGALVDTSSGMKDLVKASLLDIPQTDMVESPLSSYRNFLKLTEFMNIFIIVMVVFGSIMGFSIIFNTTIINIMERQRELASLRVLGYSKKEVRKTIFRENLFLGFISLVPGIILGRIMCEVFSRQFSNDLFTLEVILYPRTYVVAVFSMFIFIIFAQWANKNKVSGLDMVRVLKNREG